LADLVPTVSRVFAITMSDGRSVCAAADAVRAAHVRCLTPRFRLQPDAPL